MRYGKEPCAVAQRNPERRRWSRLSLAIPAFVRGVNGLIPVGQKLAVPAHKNDACEEILYGIDGVLTWTVDGTPIAVGPGQALCIPRGAVHRFENLGSEDVKQLAVITPAIMGRGPLLEAPLPARGGGRRSGPRSCPAPRPSVRRA